MRHYIAVHIFPICVAVLIGMPAYYANGINMALGANMGIIATMITIAIMGVMCVAPASIAALGIRVIVNLR